MRQGKSNFVRELPAEGPTPGRLINIIDMGVPKTPENAKFPKGDTIRLVWELPAYKKTQGKFAGEVMTINQEVANFSGSKAKLRKIVDAMKPVKLKDDDEAAEFFATGLHKLLGRAALLDVKHKDEFANVAGTMTLPVDMKPAKATLPLVYFDLTPDLWNPSKEAFAKLSPEYKEIIQTFGIMQSVFKKLPEWLQKQIEQTQEYKNAVLGIHPDAQTDNAEAPQDDANPGVDDDVPF